MKRLGEILLERGAIDVNELHTGLEASNRLGGRLGTQLLRFGFVNEKDLLEALATQFGVPYIPEALLLRTSLDVRRLIPAAVLRKFQAVPYEAGPGRLMVAMANPRDPAAIEELAGHTALRIEACVATEPAIAKALDELGADFVEFVAEEGTAATVPVYASRGWDELWTMPHVSPADFVAVFAETPPRPAIQVATFPALTPLGDETGADRASEIDEAGFRYGLQNVTSKEEVGDLLLRFAAQHLTRICLLSVHKDQLIGWLSRGATMGVEDVQALAIPTTVPSVLSDPCASGVAFAGALPPGGANAALARCFGDPPLEALVVVPVEVRGRTVALLAGDVPGQPMSVVPIGELERATKLAELAFEILILRKKIQPS
jgi:hypothetical protein